MKEKKDKVLDLDGDGKPDTQVGELPPDGIITEDADSYNIDRDGDGVAEEVFPK